MIEISLQTFHEHFLHDQQGLTVMLLGHYKLINVFLSLDLLVLQRFDNLFWHTWTPRVVLIDRNAKHWLGSQIVWTDRSLVQELVADQRSIISVATKQFKSVQCLKASSHIKLAIKAQMKNSFM